MAEQQQLINIAIQPSLVDPGVFIPQHHQMLLQHGPAEQTQQGFAQVEYHGAVSEANVSQQSNCIQESQPTMEEMAMMHRKSYTIEVKGTHNFLDIQMPIKTELNEDHRRTTPPGHPNSQPTFKQEHEEIGVENADENSHQSV
jgi:hypothetical protein